MIGAMGPRRDRRNDSADVEIPSLLARTSSNVEKKIIPVKYQTGKELLNLKLNFQWNTYG